MSEQQPGIEFHQAHFPGRAPMDAYGNGGFRFADMSHRGSLMCLPSGIYAWTANKLSDLSADAFDRVFAEAADIEIMLVGTGTDLVPLKPELKKRFREIQISADSMATGAAVRTYNVLISEGRAVAAAFLAVE